jgi:hypothetical protein
MPGGRMNNHANQRLLWQVVTGWGPTEEAALAFRGTAAFPAQDGLRLYRSMYRSRIGEVLLGTFPDLVRRLGEQAFRRLAMQYLDAYPSSDPRLEFVGQHLHDYLKSHREAPLRQLAKLAALEWARQFALLAPDPIATATLVDRESSSFAASRLELIPSLSVIETEQGGFRAVWCDGRVILECEAEADEALAWRRARQGESMPSICEAFVSAAEPATRAWKVLGGWSRRGWLVRVAPREEPES